MSIKIGNTNAKTPYNKLYVGSTLVWQAQSPLSNREKLEQLIQKAHNDYPNNTCFTALNILIQNARYTSNIGNIPTEDYDNVILTCAFTSTQRDGRIWIYLQNNNITYTVNSNSSTSVSPNLATTNGLTRYSWYYDEGNISNYYGKDTSTTTISAIGNNSGVLITKGTVINTGDYIFYNQDKL